MFKRYGLVGLLLILLVELNFIFKIEPFASWYFPIIWLGYILVIDAVVYKLKNNSLIYNNKKMFFIMIGLSALFWWIFEWINTGSVNNWNYIGTQKDWWVRKIFGTLSFATVLPAVWETYDLIKIVHLFDKQHLKKVHKISKAFLYSMVVAGILCFFLPFFLPKFAFPLVWLSFFLILDPINYMHNQHSIIGHLKDRKLKVPLSLMAAGLICGLFWEFWNYWASIKWVYDVPYVGFLKIFEMPILGYLGYLPFALELYAMYYFCMWLWKEEKMLIHHK